MRLRRHLSTIFAAKLYKALDFQPNCPSDIRSIHDTAAVGSGMNQKRDWTAGTKAFEVNASCRHTLYCRLLASDFVTYIYQCKHVLSDDLVVRGVDHSFRSLPYPTATPTRQEKRTLQDASNG